MTDFDYDVLQKKRIASGARHLKRGSRSKKCTLPSDYLTAKQRERMNGEVETFSMSKPMSFGAFKAMSPDLQDEYISGLRAKFGASQAMISGMLGVSGSALSHYLTETGHPWKTDKTNQRPNKQQKAAFLEWALGEAPSDGVEVAKAEASPETSAASSRRVQKRYDPELLSGSLTLVGNMADIASKLVSFLGVNAVYNVTVQFDAEPYLVMDTSVIAPVVEEAS